jgi:hypothetical protein
MRIEDFKNSLSLSEKEELLKCEASLLREANNLQKAFPHLKVNIEIELNENDDENILKEQYYFLRDKFLGVLDG